MSGDPFSEAFDLFVESNRISVDAEGIKIPHMVFSKAGKLTLCALAVSPDEMYQHLARTLVSERPDEIVFGMDRFILPDQGIATKDALSVSYWNGTIWVFGMIPYTFDPPTFGPVVWDSIHWNITLAREMASAWKHIKAAPHREPHPAMTTFKLTGN